MQDPTDNVCCPKTFLGGCTLDRCLCTYSHVEIQGATFWQLVDASRGHSARPASLAMALRDHRPWFVPGLVSVVQVAVDHVPALRRANRRGRDQ